VRWNERLRLTARQGEGLQPVTRRVPARAAALGYAFGVAASVAVVVVVDRSPSDFANQTSVGVLLVVAFVLGVCAPRRASMSGLAVGGSLAAAHAIYLTADVRLPYPMEPPGWAGPISLLVLIVAALLAAFVGAGARALAHRSDLERSRRGSSGRGSSGGMTHP
jgi:hypothetical protein